MIWQVKTLRIIVADDMPVQVREITEGIHANWPKWEILTASDGQEIIRQVEKSHIDIILSDIRMPRMDGLEMLSIVRRISPKTKIVFITAYPLFEYAHKALKLGAADLLLKPVDLSALYDLLAQLSSESLDGDHLCQDIVQWLEQDWSSLAPDIRSRISESFPHGCICTITAPVTDPFPQPRHLAEDLGRAIGCTIHAVDMLGSSDVRMYALICAEDEWRCGQFVQALQTAAMRHGFRAGVSVWCGDLPAQAHALWPCARNGAEQAFYHSASVIRCESPFAYHTPEFPYGQKLLSWFTAPEGWKALLDRQIETIRRTLPDSAELLRSTRHSLQDCCKMLLHDGDEAPQPLCGSELRFVTYFSEYCLCLENSMAQLEKMYRQSIDRADPVEMAMDYVRKHYMDSITLADMADMTKLSPNYFSTLFRKRTSLRFMEYVLQVRLEKASEMLANTDMFVYEIATACGYEDVRYFVRVFQKAYGLSPANFRKCFGKSNPEK